MIGGLIVTFTTLIQLSSQHICIPSDSACEAADKCSHTWVPICAQNNNDLSSRLFTDECDMHEYNCDNNQAYAKIDVKVCAQERKRKHCECSSVPTRSTTPRRKKKKKTPITFTDKTTTQSISTSEESEYLSDDETSAESTTKSTTTLDIVTTTSNTGTTAPVTVITTAVTKTAAAVTETTTAVSDTTADDTTTTSTTESITTETELLTTETETTAVVTKETFSDTVTASTEEPSTTSSTKTTAISSTSTIAPCNPNCFVPSTWETTAVSEDRDFYQILKSRYGDKVKILRDTTHYPNPNFVAERNGEVFLPRFRKRY